MNPRTPYSALCRLYDRWVPARIYDRMLDVLATELVMSSQMRCLDLCCGTATFLLLLAKAGVQVTGIDASPAMLDIAKDKIAKSQFADAIRIVQGDVTVDPWPVRPFQAVTCTLDSLNYLPFEALSGLFQRARAALDTGGVLMFDFNSEHKLKNVFGNSRYGESFEAYAYVWMNTLLADRVVFNISMFTEVKPDSRLYSRADEKHIQYLFRLSDIEDALRAAGFRRIRFTDDYSDAGATAETMRISVVAGV
jgi:ubiquinone/menaquinone biosynthesis C-methylase UbiE